MSETGSYSYKALLDNGKTRSGVIEASSKENAVKKVLAMQLTPIEVRPRSASGLNTEIKIGPNKAKTKDLAIATKQLSAMLKSGLPLVLALNTVAEQSDNKKFEKTLNNVAAHVKAGSSFSEALEEQGTFFPIIMTNMVKIGETGGFLDESLEALSKNFESEVALKGKIKSAMSYPIIVLAMAFVGIAIMLLFVVPMFSEMFDSMGQQLPLPTRMLVAMGEAAPMLIGITAVAGIAGSLAWSKAKHVKQVKQIVDPIKLKTPIIGKVYHKIIISRFAKNLSTMISSGVPLLTALNISADTSENIVLENAIRNIADEVRVGKSLERPMRAQEIFPVMMTQMIAVGEESGSLEEMFKNVSEFYDREVQETTDSLTSIIEPLLIVVIGVLIGGMVISLYLPLFSMYTSLSEG